MERQTEAQARQLIADAETENKVALHAELREALVLPLIAGSAQPQALYAVVDACGRVLRAGEVPVVLAPAG